MREAVGRVTCRAGANTDKGSPRLSFAGPIVTNDIDVGITHDFSKPAPKQGRRLAVVRPALEFLEIFHRAQPGILYEILNAALRPIRPQVPLGLIQQVRLQGAMQ